ncbi:unnamed protein product [Linum trigynum]|uniref:Uncharacterized protein n=1 Tax=Linum trigynum TaxID=586398 RepID=A0AAV2DYZ9_9ROSI
MDMVVVPQIELGVQEAVTEEAAVQPDAGMKEVTVVVADVQAEASVQEVMQVVKGVEMPVDLVVGASSSTPNPGDGFQVVTGRKNRVRAPDPTSIAKSPWNLFTGQKKIPLDDKAFPSLSKPVWKMSDELLQPAKGRGRGKKKK